MSALTRRRLLRGSAATAAALALPVPAPAVRRGALPPSDELRVAVVGLRGRGRDHVHGLQRQGGVRVVALCDVDRAVLDAQAKDFASRYGSEPATHGDPRAVLERSDVDAITVATPNHWHALLAIWACQAGKDVYLEKPVSHNVTEGRQIVHAARKYRRIVQSGTQSRSSTAIADAIAWVRAGALGRIELARGLCYKPRQSIGKVSGPQAPPASVDYDLWCGPAPKTPLRRRSLHYDWHWDFATGNGDLGNQGVHQMDVARWALGERGLPPRVLSAGGRFGYADDGNTPNTQMVFLDYEAAPLVFEVRGLPRDTAGRASWGESMDRYLGARIGVIVHCAEGRLVIPNYHSAKAFDADGAEVKSWEGARDHYANWVAAVRSREFGDLTADIEEGHVSSALCHVGNVSYQLGAGADPDALVESLAAEPAARETYERMAAHLDANDVDLATDRVALGPWLGIDPATERFRGPHAEAATARLAREGRAPFVVPDEV